MIKTIKEIIDHENLFLNEKKQFGTDKFCKHPYAEKYEEIFLKYRNKKIKFLEIGAYYGASTILWDKYFPYADITVLDNQAKTSLENIKGRVDQDRTKIIIADAYNEQIANELGYFDIINDDGPHDLASQLNCIKIYYPKLNEGGVLIIEDILEKNSFDEMIKLVPDKKYECVDYVGSKSSYSDSRVFIVWK